MPETDSSASDHEAGESRVNDQLGRMLESGATNADPKKADAAEGGSIEMGLGDLIPSSAAAAG